MECPVTDYVRFSGDTLGVESLYNSFGNSDVF
jgi:hypothetical protein